MKKFKFKFEPVLQMRKIREMEFLKQLARTQRAHQLEIEKKAQLNDQLSQAFERRENLGQNNEEIAQFYLEDYFIIGLKQKLIQADKSILRANKAVERALQVYLMAKRQSQIMEKLLERAQEEYRKARKKQSEKELEEIIILRNRLTQEAHEVDFNE